MVEVRVLCFWIGRCRGLCSRAGRQDRADMEGRDLAVDHLAAVRAGVAELKALGRDLSNFVGRCDAACAGGPRPDCLVLRDMAKPALGVAASKSERKPDVV